MSASQTEQRADRQLRESQSDTSASQTVSQSDGYSFFSEMARNPKCYVLTIWLTLFPLDYFRP